MTKNQILETCLEKAERAVYRADGCAKIIGEWGRNLKANAADLESIARMELAAERTARAAECAAEWADYTRRAVDIFDAKYAMRRAEREGKIAAAIFRIANEE